MSNSPKINGNHLMYHYLQKSLQKEDSDLFEQVVSRLINRLGIWFPPTVYRILPIALPHVVRDPSCRGSGQYDQWSSPNKFGYVRDDNTLVKSLVRSFEIQSNMFPQYNRKRLGRGFVAAHVWSRTINKKYATQNSITNSFLPNLVWLPSNVAKLTDREDSFAAKYVQALSAKIYQNIEVHCQLQPIVEKAWNLLPQNSESFTNLPDLRELNCFDVPDRFIPTRLGVIRTAVKGLRCVEKNQVLTRKKVLHTRYTEGLPSVDRERAGQLRKHLEEYSDGVEAALANLEREVSVGTSGDG